MINGSRGAPEWFLAHEEIVPLTMERIAVAVSKNSMSMQLRWAPLLAHWFLLDTLTLANQANRDGMHANALSLTRQCVEAIGIIELGVCGHSEAEAILSKWDADAISAGKLRAWLQENVWPRYGKGLWSETWIDFMRQFSAAVQPYAHYGSGLAQWQMRLHSVNHDDEAIADATAILEIRPRAYDPQKATRITLLHALIAYCLGRVWSEANRSDFRFAEQISRFGSALAQSEYLDGRETNWSQQFWAMVWRRDGNVILE